APGTTARVVLAGATGDGKGEMILRWFLSRTVRQAANSCRHVRRLLNAQRDLLGPQAVDKISAAIAATQSEMGTFAEKKQLQNRMTDLEKAAAKWLPSPPH